MTKLSISNDYQKGLSSKSDIEALKAGKNKAAQARNLPKWLTDALNLLLSAGIGGACAWIALFVLS